MITGYCEYKDREMLEKIITKCEAAKFPLENDIEDYMHPNDWPLVGIFENKLYIGDFETEYTGKKMSPEEFLAQIKTPKDLILEELNLMYERHEMLSEFKQMNVIDKAINIINKHLPI